MDSSCRDAQGNHSCFTNANVKSPKTQFEHIFQRNNVIFSFDTFWCIAPITENFIFIIVSNFLYSIKRLQTSSRRCLSGSSSCIIRSFSALILSSRRCCAAYNFKTTLLFNLRFFLLADKKTNNNNK